MPDTPDRKSVLDLILDWSLGRAEWQRDALRRIIASGPPTDADIDELVALCKQGHGAEPVVESAPLEMRHIPANPGEGASVSLASISDVVGVNQLAPGQTLAFDTDGITIVYGPNGSGKSGYSRILKRACRARMAGQIMPDIFGAKPDEASARLSVKLGNGSVSKIAWQDRDHPHPMLSPITVFDRDSGAVHVRQKNEVWFRPFGLDVPDDLAGVCQKVKERLEAERRAWVEQKNPAFDSPTWSNTSAIGVFLNGLSADSDPKSIFEVIEFTAEDETRLQQLERDLSQDPLRAAEAQRRVASKIDYLLSFLTRLSADLSDTTLMGIEAKRREAADARATASAAAVAAFGDLDLNNVGGAVWRGLWEAARRYSESLGAEGPGFPPAIGDVCVMCHQSIGNATAARMRRFDEFVRDDTEARAQADETALRNAISEISDVRIDVRLIAEARRAIRDRDPDLARRTLRFLASLRLRRRKCLAALSEGAPLVPSPLTDRPDTDVAAVATNVGAYADALTASASPEGKAKLIAKLNELKDCRHAEALKSLAEKEIDRLKKITQLHD